MFCVFIPYWKFNISKRIQPTSKIFTVLLLYKEGYRIIYFLILQLLNYERYFGLHSKKKVKCWKNLGKKIFFDSKINLLAQKKQTRYKAYVLWTSLVKSRQKTAHWDIFYELFVLTCRKAYFSTYYTVLLFWRPSLGKYTFL